MGDLVHLNDEETSVYAFDGHKSLLQNDALYEYILHTSVYFKELECMKELRELTAKHPWNFLSTPVDEAHFLGQFLKWINAKNTMEVGVFTGYSLLATALALPHDGKGKHNGAFDFIFVDADKDNCLNYHKRLIELVKVGGLIGYGNTMWRGSVVEPEDAALLEHSKYYRTSIIELNKALAVDPRVEICMLPIGDGITMCRRIS